MGKKEDFARFWFETGGFISQKIAAELLDISTGSINRLVKEGKIKSYKPESDRMPYLKSVLAYEPKEQMKRKRKKNEDNRTCTKNHSE